MLNAILIKKKIDYKTVGEAIKQYSDYCGYILEFLDKRRAEIESV